MSFLPIGDQFTASGIDKLVRLAYQFSPEQALIHRTYAECPYIVGAIPPWLPLRQSPRGCPYGNPPVVAPT